MKNNFCLVSFFWCWCGWRVCLRSENTKISIYSNNRDLILGECCCLFVSSLLWNSSWWVSYLLLYFIFLFYVPSFVSFVFFGFVFLFSLFWKKNTFMEPIKDPHTQKKNVKLLWILFIYCDTKLVFFFSLILCVRNLMISMLFFFFTSSSCCCCYVVYVIGEIGISFIKMVLLVTMRLQKVRWTNLVRMYSERQFDQK